MKMFGKCQIVPALASAVHGAIEELPLMPESPLLQNNHIRLEAPSSSTMPRHAVNSDSNSPKRPRLNSLPSYCRTTPQLDVRKAFSYFDKNRDGKLSIKEFRSVMRDLGYKTVDKRCIKQMFAEANRNGNRRTLTYDEFVRFLESKLTLQNSTTTTTPKEQSLTTATTLETTPNNHSSLPDGINSESVPKMQLDVETLFNCYDLDRNGFIEPKELRKVMKRLTGEKLSKKDIDAMISVADRNGDGLLDKDEFALLCDAF